MADKNEQKTAEERIAKVKDEYKNRADSIVDSLGEENAKWLEDGINEIDDAIKAYGERKLREAADLVRGWHIKKGGYNELAHRIMLLAEEKPETANVRHILFLDDNPERLERALKIWKSENAYFGSTVAWVINGFKKAMFEWDLVSLDHDLGGEVFVDSDREDCGMEVVRWIEENKPKVKLFRIHTWNIKAGEEMAERLRAAGYQVEQIMFPI